MSVVEKAIAWALGVANDPLHGYDQTKRWGPDYDCSSFVIRAFQEAGLPLTATYTGNMKYDFLRNGFRIVTDGSLQRGDVLLHELNHTALYLGNNQLVQASINELGTIQGGRSGDQTGAEILVRSYYNYPWDMVLRYVEETGAPEPNGTGASSPGKGAALPMLQPGSRGNAVLFLQMLLMHKWGYPLPRYGADGDFGEETRTALRTFQQERGLDADGVCGPETWAAAIGG